MWVIGGIKSLYKLNASIHWLFLFCFVLLSPSSYIQNRFKGQCATMLITTVMTMHVRVPVYCFENYILVTSNWLNKYRTFCTQNVYISFKSRWYST